MAKFNYQNIRTLQAEITSDCNAACPQCPRNVFGGSTLPNLPITRWRTEDLSRMFRNSFVEQLEMVYFCGTYGDPMMNPEVVAIAHWFRSRNPDLEIGIHTNGGVGRTEDYRALAKTVDFISFGLDGLSDTNHLYRRRVHWDRVMDRSRAYIESGGEAIWDFIVFEHNQHQVESAKTFAHTMGFKKFNVKRTSRFLNRRHEPVAYQSVQDRNGQEEYRIYPPSRPEYLNTEIRSVDREDLKTTPISCNAQRIQEVYVAADGMVFPCGWLHDRLYGPEVESTEDHIRMKQMLAQIGGTLQANCLHRSLEDIVSGDWFRLIEQSWQTQERLERCSVMCGACINPIGVQNSEIDYKD